MREGSITFLQLIAFVSLQLGIINLFPIPPLDGGHLFTLVVEGVLRRDLSLAVKERVMQAGLILLLLFMGTIIYPDVSKNFFSRMVNLGEVAIEAIMCDLSVIVVCHKFIC